MFDLEKSIAAWRQQYQYRTVFSADDLAELEQHLRDQIDESIATGLPPQLAFEQAAKEMGDWDTAEIEYRKIFWSKAKREHRIWHELVARHSLTKSYLLVAVRSMLKQKVYTTINILGLSAGLACCMLIFLFVQFEYSYDRFYEESDSIYRVTKRNPGDIYLGTDHFALTQPPLPSTLKLEFQEIEAATSFAYLESLLEVNETSYWEKGLQADPSFFNVFKAQLIVGDTATALASPYSIILTESFAGNIYTGTNPLNQYLTIDQDAQYQVTGVIADPPENSTIQYEFLTSALSDEYYREQIAANRWNSNYMYTFFRLNDRADISGIESRIDAFTDKYLYPNQSNLPDSEKESFYFQALHDVHLNSTANFDLGRHGSRLQVYLFAFIAFIILLIACINYINLAIARALKRAQEVGLRKTLGAARKQLFRQFLGESLIITFAGLALALVLTYLFLPLFSEVVMRNLTFTGLVSLPVVLGLTLLGLITAMASGFYPAYLMASLNTIDALKSRIHNLNSRFTFQQTLIVAQFAASIVLVTCGYIIYQQLDFVRNKEMGYDREHIVSVRIHDNNQDLKNNLQRIQVSLQQTAGIIEVSASHSLPANITMQQTITGWPGSAEEDALYLHVNAVDYDFLSLFGIELISGRTFSKAYPTDPQTACIINQTTAQMIGWSPEEAIGQTFIHDDVQRTVVGVVKDFHLHSMHHTIQPLLFFLDDGGRFDYLSIKVSPGSLPQSLDAVERVVQEASPFPFEYAFLDDHFDQLYAREEKLGDTFGFFTMTAFLIAALGLFGLAAFSAEQRRKEIGIRKVLGASTSRIMWILSKDFSALVLIAALVATPIAYIVASNWLETFAYRVPLTPLIFITTAALAFLIAQAAVVYQTFRAAVSNPIASLKS